jgi:hypothetical protein
VRSRASSSSRSLRERLHHLVAHLADLVGERVRLSDEVVLAMPHAFLALRAADSLAGLLERVLEVLLEDLGEPVAHLLDQCFLREQRQQG